MNPDEYERMFRAEEAHWWYAGMRAISFALLDPLLPRGGGVRILDAGCGTGGNLVHLAARGRAVGVDRSPDAIRFCRLRRVPVARAALEALPFADASFDVVTAFDVLYHRDVAETRAVAEMARVLVSGGLLLVRLPALERLRRGHDEVVHTRHRYTRDEAVRLLAPSFTVRRATYANALLLPFVYARAALDRATGRKDSDVIAPPAALDRLFRASLTLEARLLARFDLPIGSSVFVLAEKR